MTVFIALAKGELAEGIEKYLEKLGVRVEVKGKPLLTQTVGQATYRVINARDVPRLPYDFGISGYDFCEDEKLAENGNRDFVYLDELDFGKGDLVVYAKTRKIGRSPVVVMPRDIENLAKRFLNELFREWIPLSVNGSTEGYVSSGEANLGFDIMSDKNNDPNYAGTIKRNGLIVLEKIMPTQAMLIGKPDYALSDFYKAIETK